MAKRNLGDVIEQMQAEVPDSAEGLLRSFHWIASKAPYTPPEAMPGLWGLTSKALEVEIGKLPVWDWHFKVLSIWMVKPEAELREMFK